MADRLIESLNRLQTSPLLKSDQKLNVINQCLLPYPLQAAPLHHDTFIRMTTKAIVGLPVSSANGILYAPRKLR